MKIVKLKTEFSPRKGKALEKEINEIISRKGKVAFWGLGNKRPIFLNKYLETTKRHDKNRRRQKFISALELLSRVKKKHMTDKIKEPTGRYSYEFKGITPSGKLVGVHIREEIERKDKKLYLISTF